MTSTGQVWFFFTVFKSLVFSFDYSEPTCPASRITEILLQGREGVNMLTCAFSVIKVLFILKSVMFYFCTIKMINSQAQNTLATCYRLYWFWAKKNSNFCVAPGMWHIEWLVKHVFSAKWFSAALHSTMKLRERYFSTREACTNVNIAFQACWTISSWRAQLYTLPLKEILCMGAAEYNCTISRNVMSIVFRAQESQPTLFCCHVLLLQAFVAGE